MIELDKIYNEDCLIGMQRIPDGMVDCIITDLPYEVLNDGNPDAQWDKMLPLDQLWAQFKRVTKPNAAIVLFAQGMFTARLMMSNPKMWRYNLVWKKGERASGFLNAKRMPMRNHEDICVFYQQLPIYNPQMQYGEKAHPRGGGNHKNTQRCYGKFSDLPLTEPTNWKYPKSVINFDRDYDKVLHPTQKPVDLIRYLILTYTNTGGVILDATIGSGTTAVAAIKENRHFIGFELNKEYFDKAQQRINKIRQNPEFDFK